VSSHFSCIGFPVADMDAYWALARRAAAEGTRYPTPEGGTLVRWAISQGPEIWAQVDQTGQVAGATPFFATAAPHAIAITGIGEDSDEPLDGWIDGWLDPTEPDEPYSGAFPLRVNLVDFALVRRGIIKFPMTHRIELAALAHEAELYDDAATYRSAPGDVFRLPLESFASTAHAGVDDTPEDQEAIALAVGRIARARLLINPVSETPFWWVQIAVHGVVLDAFADRETLGRDPQEGNILAGSFWLVGRTAPGLEDPSYPNITRSSARGYS
jgi:hypothetical protein